MKILKILGLKKIGPPQAENFEDLGGCFMQKMPPDCTQERVFCERTPSKKSKKISPAAGYFSTCFRLLRNKGVILQKKSPPAYYFHPTQHLIFERFSPFEISIFCCKTRGSITRNSSDTSQKLRCMGGELKGGGTVSGYQKYSNQANSIGIMINRNTKFVSGDF